MQPELKQAGFKLIYGSLNRRIAFYILLFSSVITFFLTGFQLYRNYSISIDEVEADIDSIAIQSVPILAQALWNIDDELLDIVLKSIAQMPNIESVVIHEFQTGEVIEIGEKQAKYTEVHQFELSYYLQESKRELGALIITAELDSVRQKIFSEALTILLNQAIKTFLVSIFIMLLLFRIFGRHLSKIVNYIRSNSTQDLTALAKTRRPLVLDRKAHDDELNVLVNTLNRAYSRAEEASVEIKKEIDARVSAEKILFDEHERVVAILDSLSESIIELDYDNKIGWCNEAACRLLEVGNKKDAIGALLSDLIKFHFESEHKHEMPLDSPASGGEISETVYHGYASVGDSVDKPVIIKVTPMRLNTNQAGYAILVSDKLDSKQYEEINYYATRDFLTGLPNRYRFDKLLEETVLDLNIHENLNKSLAVIDIDSLKIVNDIGGHEAGDNLLLNFAKLLEQDSQDLVVASRIGGDEFAIIYNLSVTESERRLQTIIQETEKLRVPDVALSISASIGLTKLVVKDDPIVALSRADTACYDIKNAGGGGVGIAKTTQPVLARGKWQTDYKRIRSIEAVISDGGFVLYGQPIVAIQNGQALHNRTELLLRLQEDDKITLPGEFLPLAERYRLGVKIDLWVINQVHHLITSGKLTLKNLNINLGMHSLNNVEIYRAVEKLMNDVGEEWSICFELTEHTLVNNFVNVKAFTHMAQHLGAKFAIDDFGDGYASYGMISNFPVDYIKIDGNLVTKISQEPSKKAIVSSIQAIASSMKVHTIAEHVPDETTLALLSEIGVHYAQSFYTGRPMPLD